jgi:hypothetical protein
MLVDVIRPQRRAHANPFAEVTTLHGANVGHERALALMPGSLFKADSQFGLTTRQGPAKRLPRCLIHSVLESFLHATDLVQQFDFRRRAAGVLQNREGHAQVFWRAEVFLEIEPLSSTGKVVELPLRDGFSDLILDDTIEHLQVRLSHAAIEDFEQRQQIDALAIDSHVYG